MGVEKKSDGGALLPASARADWADLRLFLHVAESGSISAAPKSLQMSQPTVSQRLSDLEFRLNTQLVVRGPSGIVLTETGQRIKEHVAVMQRSAAAIDRLMREFDDKPEGRVKIAAPDGLGSFWIGPRIPALQRASNPGITLSLDGGLWPDNPVGEALYQVTDLSSVWVVADVFEQDIGLVKPGAKAKVTITAYPNQVFEGRITYVYPTMKAETRTVAVRIELANPGQLLKPAMFAQVELPVGGKAPMLVVPDPAVIDSGTRKIVLVQVQDGRFEPREVELGARGESHVQVLKGVREGEQVVVAANFLIDAESNLKAAVGGLGGHAGHGAASKGAEAPAPPGSPPAPPVIGHKADGSIDGIDPKAGTVSLIHGPIASLKWPAMTMEFKVAHGGLLQGLKPGQAVAFEFVERQPGEYVVTSITAVPAARAPAPPAMPAVPASPSGKTTHSGH